MRKSFIRGISFFWLKRGHLTLEGEAGTDLVGSLVEVLGVEGSAQAEGDTRAEEDVVSESGNTAVVDLGLNVKLISKQSISLETIVELTLAKEEGSRRYLLATSKPTLLPALESQVALAPAST